MLTIYLDSSDYSRFGDVLRGKGDCKTIEIFERLLSAKEAGKLRFVYSMPILSELLQYDEEFADTTIYKAQAVEKLCGHTALIWPGRLVAWEVAVAAANNGLMERPVLKSPISDEDRWFPNIEDALDELKGGFRRALDEALSSAALVNRKQRRIVEANARKLNLNQIAGDAAPEFAEKYGLQVGDVRRSLIAVLENKISPSEGSLRLFSVIARPTTFVQTYFVGYDGEKDFPQWLSSTGRNLQASLEQSRKNFAEIDFKILGPEFMKNCLSQIAVDIGGKLLDLARAESKEFALDDRVVDIFSKNRELGEQVACRRIITGYLPAFMQSNLGLRDGGHKPERSAAGDIIHSLYLPYCDFWRGDRRFAHTLKEGLPDFAPKIVAKLSDLPDLVGA